ncbi:MAG TPA: polysaccharide ABC transporter ATP-binding protein [Planctomycetota bacterium]|nr:polysaccharide ABC transporter ATP-binding protein [Planctomycetota bacterium]
MSRDVTVSVRDLGKLYKVYPDSRSRLVEAFTGGRVKRHSEKWALRGCSFELERGAALGVVGANGAGKSTLLKMLTGTMRPTEGSYAIKGTLGSLLELGAGFHPEFSGRDNIYMNAAILGVSRAEVKRRYDELAEFADLGEYLERPVRTYSSGMQMRLGFAVAMMARPEVMILDEVLAVGDQHFQKKCMDRIREIRQSGATILFVSHSVYHVRQICDRALWIHQGRVVMDGHPIEVTDEYSNFQHALSGGQAALQSQKTGTVNAAGLPHLGEIVVARTAGGPATDTVGTEEETEIRLGWKNPTGQGRFHIGCIVYRNDDVMCFAVRTAESLPPLEGAGGEVALTFRNQLLSGEYYVSGFLLDESCEHVVDQRLAWTRFKCVYPAMEKGVFLPERSWRVTQTAR